jgi:hypothetical protein
VFDELFDKLFDKLSDELFQDWDRRVSVKTLHSLQKHWKNTRSCLHLSIVPIVNVISESTKAVGSEKREIAGSGDFSIGG